MAGEIEQIKKKLDIAEVLRGYIDLRPAGRNLKALCPFHGEKTPSFIVSPERQTWRCFGACGEGGDVFSFVMKHENLEFHEALKILAEKAGVQLREVSPREQREFGVLYDINEAAKNLFREYLPKHAGAGEYLKGRKLAPETIEEFELGFAPGGEMLVLALLKQGHEMGDIARAGLSYRTPHGLYRDKFDQRIMFPIYNTVGKVVAFTGRVLPHEHGGPSTSSGEVPKYFNSPETPIFNKSKVLYGFHRSKNEIAKTRSAFLVEGQMDFLMAWQAGVRDVIAVSGTALTSHHLERLRRIADSVVLSFDADEAGVRALERALDIFLNFDFHVKTISLGTHKDPADAVAADPAFLQAAVSRAVPAFEYLFGHYFREGVRGDIAEKKRIVRHALLKVRAVKSPVEQAVWLEALSSSSGIPASTLASEMAAMPIARADSEPQKAMPAPATASEPASALVEPGRIDLIVRRMAALAALEEQFLVRVRDEWEFMPEGHRAFFDGSDASATHELQMRASYELGDTDPELREKEFEELMRNLKMEVLRGRQAVLRAEIRALQARSEEDAGVDEALRAFQTITRQLHDLKK